jgi:peptidoglycan/xylan/chitin deacetylase (PgdA/CDA1 family)
MFAPLISAVAAAGALTLAGYHTMGPRSQLYGRTFTGNPAKFRQLALTYDDGPNDPHTLELLEVLAKHNVRATFFMLGRHVAERPQVAQAVAQAGHVIGNHTFNHPNLIFSLRAQLIQEIEQCRRALAETVGEHSNLFRPPFGGRRPQTLRTVRALGMLPVMWTVAANDWSVSSAEKIEQRVARQVRGGDVILMHDGGHSTRPADRSHTVGATHRLIARYKEQGFEFVTVPELMKG